MTKTQKITYKVFLFERVKKKVRFFNTETYPLQIRLTAGSRTLYLKSYFFSVMQQNKHQQEFVYNAAKKISLEDIIESEEELIKYILNKQQKSTTLDAIRQEYSFFSYDILQELDEGFKKFLVSFFYAENLPAYALFIKNDGINYTSEFILENLQMSLQQTVFSKLLQQAAEKAPPLYPFHKIFQGKN